MTWEYLNTVAFDVRYMMSADVLPDTSNMTILDLNCGQARFRYYINYSEYLANDVLMPENTDGIYFLQSKDTDIDIPCDVLACFGMTGGVVAQHPLESATAGDTVLRLTNDHSPSYVVLEWVQECDSSLLGVVARIPENYQVISNERFDVRATGQFYDKRHLIVLEKK